ncbi:MAG: insulinase family protein [Acidobacteriota bacterium]
MWKRIAITALAIAVLAGPGTLSAAAVKIDKLKYPTLGKIHIPEVERVELPNGLVLMMVEDHELPLVHFRALVRAGMVYHPEGNAALPGVFSEVQRTGGTGSQTGDEIDEILEQIGASVETSLGTSSGSVSAECLKEYVDTVLPIFADVLRNPEFREDKIDLAKTQFRGVISRRNDDVGTIVRREFGKLLYDENSPYASQVEYADIGSLTREDLQEFHQKFYHPNGVILGIWGNFDTAAMKAKIEVIFGSWPRKEIRYPAKPEVSASVPRSINYIEKTDIEQAFIRVGHLSVRWDDPDLPKIEIMNSILGSGGNSRIFRTVRTDKGLAYSAGGGIRPAYDHPGYFFASLSTKFATTREALDTMLDVIREFREAEVTDEELALAKDAYLNSFAFQFDSTGEVLGRLMTYEYFGYPEDFLQKYRAGVEKVTAADVLEVAKRHIHPDRLVIVVAGDASRFDKPLAELGQVAQIDITIPEPKSQEMVAAATPESLARGREVSANAVRSVGGAEPVAEVETLTLTTSITLKLPQGELEASGTQTFVYLDPPRIRVEMNAPFGKIIQVLDGENGWSQTPQGIGPLPEQQAAALRKESKFGWIPLMRALASEEVEVQSLGSILFEEKDVEDLLLRFADGTTAHVYVDSGDYTVLGIRRMGNTLQGPAEIVQVMSDFRSLGDLKFPFSITTKAAGQVIQEVQISEVEVNSTIDDQLFARPE